MGELSYSGAHNRVKRLWGGARRYPCVVCGAQALDWAYDGMDPGQIVGKAGLGDGVRAWSTDPGYYMPLCRACHIGQDRTGRKYGPRVRHTYLT